jgi:hypothetical protein
MWNNSKIDTKTQPLLSNDGYDIPEEILVEDLLVEKGVGEKSVGEIPECIEQTDEFEYQHEYDESEDSEEIEEHQPHVILTHQNDYYFQPSIHEQLFMIHRLEQGVQLCVYQEDSPSSFCTFWLYKSCLHWILSGIQHTLHTKSIRSILHTQSFEGYESPYFMALSCSILFVDTSGITRTLNCIALNAFDLNVWIRGLQLVASNNGNQVRVNYAGYPGYDKHTRSHLPDMEQLQQNINEIGMKLQHLHEHEQHLDVEPSSQDDSYSLVLLLLHRMKIVHAECCVFLKHQYMDMVFFKYQHVLLLMSDYNKVST